MVPRGVAPSPVPPPSLCAGAQRPRREGHGGRRGGDAVRMRGRSPPPTRRPSTGLRRARAPPGGRARHCRPRRLARPLAAGRGAAGCPGAGAGTRPPTRIPRYRPREFSRRSAQPAAGGTSRAALPSARALRRGSGGAAGATRCRRAAAATGAGPAEHARRRPPPSPRLRRSLQQTGASAAAAAAAAATGTGVGRGAMAEGEDLQTFTSIMDALVRISTSMKNMERELVCPVCKEMYKQPLALPCAHNVCHICASEVLLQHGYLCCDPTSEPSSPAATPATRSPRLGRRAVPKPDRLDRLLKSGFGTYPGRKRGTVHPQTISFPCPACQRDVDLGERGLGSLFRNLTLERVVERYRQTINISAAIMCQFCKPPQLEATKGCTECKSSFCNECFKLYHPWGTQKAQHEPTPPTLTFRPKGLMCPEHKEEVTHYCKTCQRLVCQLCRVRRTHTSHKITPVLSAYQALREKLSKSLAYILSSQDTVQTQIAELEETVKHTEVNGSQAKEEVSQLIQGLCAMLEEKRATLLQAIEECQQERLASLHGQIQEHQAMLENSGMVGYAQEVLKETDHPCFVQAAKQLHNRILRATDSLQSFRPAATASFSHFQLDVSRELKLLTDLAFIRVPEAPVIDTQRTYAYDQIFLCWRLPQHSPPAWHYTVEYRKTDTKAKGLKLWQRREEVRGTSALVEYLDTDSVYVLRVKGCNKAGFGEYSEDIYLHTPPAPVLNFFLDNRWGFNRDRLAISKDQRAVRSVPGIPMLFAAERLMTSCHLSIDLVIGDVAITQGKSYWACCVDPSSYLVKVGVGLETKLQEWFQVPQDVVSPRYDPDSGHDSGAEDTTVEAPPPYAFLTIGMGKILLSHGSALTSRDPNGCTVPLPPRIGICLDYEQGKVSFYDAVSFRELWECGVDCSGPICPAFCFIGGGALHLQELVANKQERKVTIGGFAKLD
uniref:Tripartite motif containing 46 n=1 Tax=Calidris pygmaea TaxID=425635 RepID=A0A8C3K2K1_9CHAR